MESFLNDRVMLHAGDCMDVLARLEECSIDSCVSDPPYHLTSIVKRFGSANAKPAKSGKTGAYKRAASGFMGKQWDGGDIAFNPELWALVWRALKPGAHLVAFSGTRTYHRMACAIEDAGFEIRDQLAWCYGSGFPKSHDVSKALDKREGHWRGRAGAVTIAEQVAKGTEYERSPKGDPITAAAAAGWGTALKPAWEPICLARKPLAGTVAANVLAHGTGALNIDACRVEFAGTNAAAAAAAAVGFAESRARGTAKQSNSIGKESRDGTNSYDPFALKGRWPANLVHDGSDEVVAGFPDVDGVVGALHDPNGSLGYHGGAQGVYRKGAPDSGSAARFFYTAKADADDRIGSKHPTVKPVDLMQWLVRLVTPKGGVVLDPFSGTGTTGEAAWREGMRAVLVEREAEYQADIRRRMSLCLAGPDEKRRESLKARGLVDDAGPLFGGSDSTRGGGADRFTESSRTKNRPDWIEGVKA